MTTRTVIDVSALPKFAFGHKGLIWWGTAGFMVIEGSMFVMALIVYFYLRLKVDQWPPSLPNPNIGFATANLLLVLASCVPNALAKKAAERFDLRKVQIWLVVLTIVGLVALVLRRNRLGVGALAVVTDADPPVGLVRCRHRRLGWMR